MPPPRRHAIRYHGVFVPNSKDRARVVPGGGGGDPAFSKSEPNQTGARSPAAVQPAPVTDDLARLGPRYRVPLAELLRKVFSLDVLDCPQCGGRMQLITCIAEAGVAKRILDHLGLPSTGPPVVRSRAPEETFDPPPEYDGADSTWDE